MIKRIFLILWGLIISISMAQADVQVSDFCGRYNIVVDGVKEGILQLTSYTDKKDFNLKGTYMEIGTKEKYQIEGFTGHINPDIPEHKITFFVNFKENRQMFEGYLMCKTKDTIVGYTMVGKIPIGFYATKEVKFQPIKERPLRKPLFQKTIKDKISELRYILKDIRTTILVYNGQHHPKAKLGFIWDEENKRQVACTHGDEVAVQLLQRTDRNGLTESKGANRQKLDYGPYFHEFPINPITLGNTIYLVDSPLPIEKILSPKDYDWIYNLQTCEFKAGGEAILPSDVPERREDNSLLNF